MARQGSSGKLRVLMVGDHAVPGRSGPHNNVVASLIALAERDDVELTGLYHEYDPGQRYATSGKMRMLTGFNPHNTKQVALNVARVARAARGQDVVYVPMGAKTFVQAWAGVHASGLFHLPKLIGGPNVAGIPGIMDPYIPSPLFTTRMADAWIEMSDVTLENTMRFGTARNRIWMAPHVVDTERFHPSRANREVWRKHGLDPARLKIVYVGRMNEELKGIAQLVDAFQRIRATVPEVDLVLIAKDGPMLTEAHRKIAGLHHIGPQYGLDLPIHLASADLFMAASRWETYWNTPLEAMAGGLPCVVSNVGATAEFFPSREAAASGGANGGVTGGVNGGVIVPCVERRGWKFKPDADKMLAEAAIPLLQDAELRRAMGEAGRAKVLADFTEASLGRDLVKCFREVVAGQASTL